MGKAVVISLLVAALAVLLGERVLTLRKRFLASREVENNHLPNCVLFKNLDQGSEDITILPNGLAFISTGLRYPGLPFTGATGKIFSLDLEDPRMKPVELRMPRNLDLESFNPHGISVYADPSAVFKNVNDIVAVGADAFYATNDHYFEHEILKAFVEPLLGLPWTNVVYYSPEEVKVVSEGYYFANGINISPDKRHIYVADILDHNVHVLERKEDNGLVSVKSVPVGSLCDNIEVDPESGDLWLGCHPNAWKLFMFDPKNLPGSEVIQIQNIHSDQPEVRQVFADDGRMIMGSSVAAPYGGKLLIGTVFHKAMYCDLE
ncbi:hypothetical protein L3Q82_002350 [Scortum barcoo]|uniref:Uncharacterized protein n=1 Tax=Scortum barcoo TaxID=214431 RepID=A0ACB8W0Z5_9TELE|nr:hypothetical protein L3Q82_002350 [Scortum barcoo]